MKNKLFHLLCLVLCAALLCTTLPIATVSAAEISTEAEPYTEMTADEISVCTEKLDAAVQPLSPELQDQMEAATTAAPRSIETDEDGNLLFATFADLQTIAAATYSDYTSACYVGTDPLVIESNLTLPDNLWVFVPNQLQVPAGVTFTGSDSNYIYADELVIAGTLTSAFLEAKDALTVTGAINNDFIILLDDQTALTGGDKIKYRTTDSYLLWLYSVTDLSTMKAAAVAANAATDPYWFYSLEMNQADIVINEDITLPQNCEVIISDSITVTIAAGSMWNVECYLWVYAPLVVEGTLNNEAIVDIYYDDGGSVTIAGSGAYTGSGSLFVNSETLTEPGAGVPGLNLSGYQITETNDGGHYWELAPAVDAPEDGTPSELEWEVLRLVNLERYQAGVDPLATFEQLQQAAGIRAEEILEFFSHDRPDGTDCFSILDDFNLDYNAAGENIAMGQISPEHVMTSWMNSPGHRGNILDPDFTQIGIGNQDAGWTQLFLGTSGYTSMELILPETEFDLGTSIDEMKITAVLHGSRYGDCYLPVLSVYCAGFDPNQLGSQSVTVSVLGFTETFQVSIRSVMYRLYNPYTQEHLLTRSNAEKILLVSAGWTYDGIAWNVPAAGDPVYRLYNPYDDFHFYTMSLEEVDSLTPLGWKVDGVVCASASEKDGIPIYRLFNPYEPKCYHLYTASVEERDWLVSLGWQLEGVAWYAVP